MAILENIRKRTTVLILIIGLALFAFVASGIFTADFFTSGGGKVGSSVAEINGKELSIDAFRQKLEIATNNSGPTASSLQLVNQVYEQEVRSTILEEQFETLGINIEQDQIINYLRNTGYAQNPQFHNANGVFDEEIFKNAVADWKAEENQFLYQNWLQTEQAIIGIAKEQTYFNLIKAGVGATLNEGKLDYKLGTDKVNFQYVRVPYTSIADSTITVSKSEIASYIKQNKDDYQQEKARDIQFVLFEENPSESDDAAVKKRIQGLLNDGVDADTNEPVIGLRNATDLATFLDINSDTKFDTVYRSKKELSARFADSLFNLPVGGLYGPYKDGNFYKVAKMNARKRNGEVKASHILIKYAGSQTADDKVTRTKEEAEAEANRLLKEARKSGTVFADLAKENSEGPSAPNGGDLGFFQEGRMVPEFNDFSFENPKGALGVVETDFGFHVIKVDDKADLVQIGYLSLEVAPSEETSNQLFTDVTKFEMASTEGGKVFTDLAKESNYVVRPVNKIKALDENLPGLANQRSIVKWAFEDDTEIGDIKRFNVNNGYAVVQVTAAYEEGLMSVEDATATVLPKIRKERKASQIISLHQGKSMEALSSDTSQAMSNANSITVKSPTIPGSGSEPLVVGTAFSMAEGDTSGLIEGNSGVFIIKVTAKELAPDVENYSTYANTLKNTAAGKVNTAVYNALKEASEIEDKRETFY